MTQLRWVRRVNVKAMSPEDAKALVMGEVDFDAMADKYPAPGYWVEEPPTVTVERATFRPPWGFTSPVIEVTPL